jgi:SAM-dependent methyltransferase/uncharacterized protein YbaR (Trm112 family)
MNRLLLDFLVCPQCQDTLECSVAAENDRGIETGMLICRQCGERYPIAGGIPRFVTMDQPLSGQNVKTADAFGWEWQEFRELHDLTTYRAQFLDWIDPIQPEYFRGKIVLDAGCGMGRFSLVSAQFGAELVLAIDASDAADAAFENSRAFPNIQVIQADINRLPLRQEQQAQIDFIYCIGVLHHLDDPQAGFKALTSHLRCNGSIFAWVYGRENNGWLVNVVNPIRKAFTSRLPRRALYGLAWLLAAMLHPIVKVIYRTVNERSSLHGLRRLLPYNGYLAWLGQFGFRHNHHVVFDHLVAPVAFYIRREEYESWFPAAGLEVIDLSWRNQNSWRGHGRFARPPG